MLGRFFPTSRWKWYIIISSTTCGKTLKDKLQRIQSQAAIAITSAKYDIRSTDILASLGWQILHARRKQLKLVLMYKILNKQFALNLSKSFIRIRDYNKHYHLRNSESDLAPLRPWSNSLNRTALVVLCYGTTFPKRLKERNLYGSLRRVSALSVPDSELCK